jgi:hypothetical protein
MEAAPELICLAFCLSGKDVRFPRKGSHGYRERIDKGYEYPR